jgi:hypothetical protein
MLDIPTEENKDSGSKPEVTCSIPQTITFEYCVRKYIDILKLNLVLARWWRRMKYRNKHVCFVPRSQRPCLVDAPQHSWYAISCIFEFSELTRLEKVNQILTFLYPVFVQHRKVKPSFSVAKNNGRVVYLDEVRASNARTSKEGTLK